MNLYDLYDPAKIEIPKTNKEFWLALLRVRNHYIAEACFHHANSRYNEDHIWHTWLLLDHWLDKAFYRMCMGDDE